MATSASAATPSYCDFQQLVTCLVKPFSHVVPDVTTLRPAGFRKRW